MRLKGNILKIKNKRDDSNSDLELLIDKVEYVTYKKDGRFFQPFDYVDELELPLIISGDQLARINSKHLDEGEHEFLVYDKTEDGYELNENKKLILTTEYDFDADLIILRTVDYTVTVSNEEFDQIKKSRIQEKKSQRGRKNR